MPAEAFQAVAEYKEFPYAIRRRRHDTASEERVRLSEELRQVQAKLTFHEEWTRIEDGTVGSAHRELLQRLPSVAGAACNEAWATPAIKSDEQMDIPREQVDLAELASFERNCTDAAQEHVSGFMKWRR